MFGQAIWVSALDTVNAWSGIETALPEIESILSFTNNGASAWANTFRIDALLKNGSEESYFLKVGPLPFRGAGGRETLLNVCHKWLIYAGHP